MVRKQAENGTFYHGPPYTAEEEADLYRRMGSGYVTVVRPKDNQAPKPKRKP
jgi:hypothetical protein